MSLIREFIYSGGDIDEAASNYLENYGEEEDLSDELPEEMWDELFAMEANNEVMRLCEEGYLLWSETQDSSYIDKYESYISDLIDT